MNDKNKPYILITNDDGVTAEGIKSLTEAVLPLGEVVVLAPDRARSGMSGAITSTVPIQVRREAETLGLTVYSCTGTPVDCVKLAINEILDKKPDYILSGINCGTNASICVMYSGTMGAAIEGCIFGIPSVGFSLATHNRQPDYKNASLYANKITKKLIEKGLPKGICLNVNIPDTNNIMGIRVCSQTDGHWVREFIKDKDEEGNVLYWLTGSFYNEEPDNETSDEWALKNNYVAIVPTKIDLTSYSSISEMKSWENL